MERLTERNEEGIACIKSSNTVEDLIEKLCQYEELEEQWLLMKLPCRIGDTVYYINPKTKRIESTVIQRYWLLGFKNFVIDRDERKCSFGQFGKNVFLTNEEAERVLAERIEYGKIN